MQTVIVTDSAADLPAQVIEAYGLHVIPTPVLIDGVDFFDGKTLQPHELYAMMKTGGHEIKTYHINPAMFEQELLPYAQAGQPVLYICFSTGIAATFNAANLAREALVQQYPDFQMEIVDSKKASVGFGMLVLRLLQLQKAGLTHEQLMEAALFYRAHIRTLFTVETLRYLIQGGRVGKASGNIGEVMGMKPVLEIGEDGALEKIGVVRGRAASLNSIVQQVQNKAVALDKQTVGICHAGDTATLALVREKLQQAGANTFFEGEIGCAIGAHVGPGTVGVFYLDAPDDEYRALLEKVQ